MGIIHILIELATYPLNYPIVWLIFSWLVWSLLKIFKRTRPAASIMLIYSAAVAIAFVKGEQRFNACMNIDLCAPYFELLPFLAEVAFWFIILYASITLNTGIMLKSGKYRWLGLLMVALGVWHFIGELIKIINSVKTPIGSEISLITITLWLLLPWLFWMLFIGLWQPPQPTARIMLMYSVSVSLTYVRLLNDATMNSLMCGLNGSNCQETVSLISFLAEIAYWFIPLYVLLKLVTKLGTTNLSVATS